MHSILMRSRIHSFIAAIRLSLSAATVFGFSIAASHAAAILWEPVHNISGDSDVSTSGILINAVNLGSAGVTSPTINGVTFNGFVFLGTAPMFQTVTISSGNFSFTATKLESGNNTGSTSAPFSNLSAPYQELLGSVGGTAVGSFTFTMNALAVGTQYQVELWSNVSNGSGSANQLTSATAVNTLVLNDSPSGANGAIGQFGIGTFTADSTTQQITFTGAPSTYLNAVQLRSVPEPGTSLMLAFGACLTAAFRRRRSMQE